MINLQLAHHHGRIESNRRRGKHLVRIHDAVRVERAFHRRHEFDGGAVLAVMNLFGFHHP